MIPVPFAWRVGAALAAAALCFGAGFQVRGWRCDSQIAAIERAAVKRQAKAQANAHDQSTGYEQERADARESSDTREATLRTIYRDRVVPVACEPDPRAVGLLREAVDAANQPARESGD